MASQTNLCVIRTQTNVIHQESRHTRGGRGMMWTALLIVVTYIAGCTILGFIIHLIERNDGAADTIEED